MKKILKKYLSFVCALVCVLGCMSFNVCADEAASAASQAKTANETEAVSQPQTAQVTVNADELTFDAETEKIMQEQYDTMAAQYGEAQLKASGMTDLDSFAKIYFAESLASMLNEVYTGVDRKTLEAALTGNEEKDADTNAFLDATEGVGEIKAVNVKTLTLTETEYSISGIIDYSKKDVEFTMNYNIEDGSTAFTFDKVKTLGEKMEGAALNTVLGMGTVFSVLIFLCLVIACFNLFKHDDSAKKETKAAPADKPAPVQAAPAATVTEDVTNDAELIAVISAAIAAAEGDSAGGYKVRSIKRVRFSK